MNYFAFQVLFTKLIIYTIYKSSLIIVKDDFRVMVLFWNFRRNIVFPHMSQFKGYLFFILSLSFKKFHFTLHMSVHYRCIHKIHHKCNLAFTFFLKKKTTEFNDSRWISYSNDIKEQLLIIPKVFLM